MPEQKLYEEALKRKDSTEFFETILGDPHSTPESKLYAACGLWENNQQEKIHLKKDFLKLDVSILQADILRKENLVTVLSRIKQYGCKWRGLGKFYEEGLVPGKWRSPFYQGKVFVPGA